MRTAQMMSASMREADIATDQPSHFAISGMRERKRFIMDARYGLSRSLRVQPDPLARDCPARRRGGPDEAAHSLSRKLHAHEGRRSSRTPGRDIGSNKRLPRASRFLRAVART